MELNLYNVLLQAELNQLKINHQKEIDDLIRKYEKKLKDKQTVINGYVAKVKRDSYLKGLNKNSES